jgi:hypothetical protein
MPCAESVLVLVVEGEFGNGSVLKLCDQRKIVDDAGEKHGRGQSKRA